MGMSETGVAGAELIVNRPVVEKAVLAFVVGEESPCCDSTCQNFGPGVSDSITCVGSVYWLKKNSMFVKPGSVAISRRYPEACGFGTCAHWSVTGKVSVGFVTGAISTGGGPIG